MSPAVVSPLLFRLPGPQRFIIRLVEDLGERRSLLVLVPDGINSEDVWCAMWDELWRREFTIYEAWLPEMRGEYLPAAALGEKLGVRWPSPTAPRTVANLAVAPFLPDVIWLGGFADLPAETRVSWLEFLLQWAQASKNIIDQGGRPATLCLICPAWTLPTPPSEGSLYLSVRWWWGMPSALELRLLCRIGEDNAQNEGVTAGWREYILPSLAGSDLSLAEWLWDDVYSDINHLTHRLVKFAERRGWTLETLKSLSADAWRGTSRMAPPPAVPDPDHLLLWGRGVLSSTPEYGLELHSAALALLGRVEEIQHRLWRAQAPLLLPLLDSLRLDLCRHLTRLYGSEWPVRWQPPQSPWETAEVRENPLATQWGHLEHLIKNYPALRAERRWLQLLGLARFIRNRLAHYRTVDFNSYKALCREIDKAKEILY